MAVNRLFQVHKLNEKGLYKAGQIAESFSNLLEELAEYCPEGRELAIVKTKLEEAAFFAKKSMAGLEENREQ